MKTTRAVLLAFLLAVLAGCGAGGVLQPPLPTGSGVIRIHWPPRPELARGDRYIPPAANSIVIRLFQNSLELTDWATTIVRPQETALIANIPIGFALQPGDMGKIAFRSDREANNEIHLMNPDGTDQINVTNNPADDILPRWSPDGSKIAFMSNRDGNFEIYMMNTNGTNQINLTNDPADDWYPSWSPF